MTKIIFLLILSALTFTAYAEDPIIEVEQGLVEGVDMGKYDVYKGIRYAKPPVGNLRWKPPQPPTKWNGVYKADTYGSASLQVLPTLNGLSGGAKVVGSEDCLFLNIWVPKNAKSKGSMPVMVWIHGGAYVMGSGEQKAGPLTLYDAAKLAQSGEVIIVSHNYRLASMGFFAHEEATNEKNGKLTGTTGNYALLDHIAVLKWVKKNIEQFGGDPNKVTIFGESAGGTSVIALIASPLAKNLFSAAIIQSGVFLHNQLIEHMRLGEKVANDYGLSHVKNKLNKLRDVDGKRFVRDYQMTTVRQSHDDLIVKNGYVVDGVVLKYSPLETILRGEHNKVPVMIGTNANEMNTLALGVLQGFSTSSTKEDFINNVSLYFDREVAEKATEVFNNKVYGNYRQAILEFMEDALFHAPAKQMADALEKHAPGSIYKYKYAKEFPGVKAGHGTELIYLFGNQKLTMPLVLPYKKALLFPVFAGLIFHAKVRAENRFSKMLMGYWTRFARNHTPNELSESPRDVFWPKYASGQVLEINDVPRTVGGYRSDTVNFVDKLTRSQYVNVARCRETFISL